MKKLIIVVVIAIMLSPIIAKADNFLGFSLPDSLKIMNGTSYDFIDGKPSIASLIKAGEFLNTFDIVVGAAGTDLPNKPTKLLAGLAFNIKKLEEAGVVKYDWAKLLDIEFSLVGGWNIEQEKLSVCVFVNLISIELFKILEGK